MNTDNRTPADLGIEAAQIDARDARDVKRVMDECGVLSFRKPRGKKWTFMMGCGGAVDSGVEFIRRDMPAGAFVYCWFDQCSGESRQFSIVPDYDLFGIARPGRSMPDLPKRIKPHSLFKVWSADEVAECIDGVSAVPGLYEALYAVMIERKNTPGESYREIPDDYADRCLSKSWSKLTREQQSTLNDLAAKHYAANAMSR